MLESRRLLLLAEFLLLILPLRDILLALFVFEWVLDSGCSLASSGPVLLYVVCGHSCRTLDSASQLHRALPRNSPETLE